MFMVVSCCKPANAIDETHLKGNYIGVMFVVTTMDGNEKIYPLAFGFDDGKNDQSRTWFLTELRNVIRSLPNLMIISNRHISINNYVR